MVGHLYKSSISLPLILIIHSYQRIRPISRATRINNGHSCQWCRSWRDQDTPLDRPRREAEDGRRIQRRVGYSRVRSFRYAEVHS